MRDFKRASNLLWNKNALAIIVMGIFLILSFFMMSRSGVENIERHLIGNYLDIKYLATGEDPYNPYEDDFYKKILDEKDDDEILDEIDKYINELSKKYDLDLELISDPSRSEEAENKYAYRGLERALTEEESLKSDAYYLIRNFFNNNMGFDYKTKNINMTQEVFGGIFLVAIFGVFLALFYSGFENITPYYEFTKTFPWSRKKTYITKIINGFIFILIFCVLEFIISYFSIKSLSNFSEHIIFKPSVWNIVNNIITPLSLFLITLSLGEISGNFIGNLGLLFIALAGFWLIKFNIHVVLDSFDLLYNNHPIYKFENNIFANPILGVIYNPLYGYGTDMPGRNLAIIGITLIYVLVGFLFIKIAKGERTGLMVLNKPIHIFAEILGIITTTNIFALFFNEIGELNTLSTIVMYVVLAVINTIFYRKLFKVRIGI